ncbi:unnamed protein product [Candidula unifasciata]|uniref:AIG1-type G domain-containing protein n=1 Tax=Candidula unifasciata TaxID=100452 RepID=A0A8S3ZVX4_9EUPU|nr:unnamed protein product [Candidula unifasciata]
MAEEKVNVFLMGKTGHGKSTTGNMMLGRKVFKSKSSATSTTKDVDFSFASLINFLLMVVDGPGLQDTCMDEAEDKQAISRSMSNALAMCYEGIHAFLFVLQFGVKFTDEEKSVLDALKCLFGDGYLDRMIVVVTYGASFYDAMEDEDLPLDFHSWCRNQEGAFRELYESCRGRFVLVENREKDSVKKQAKRMELVNLAAALKREYAPYNCQCFEQTQFEREKLIVELKVPILKKKIQKEVSLLTAEIEQFFETSSDGDRDKIMDRVRKLLDEIDQEDQRYGHHLDELRELVVSVGQNLDNKLELVRIGADLENTRKAKDKWLMVTSRMLHFPVVRIFAGVALLTSRAVFTSKEKKLTERQKKLQEIKNA